MSKKSPLVLIVEDHSLNLKIFRDILRARGFDTVEDRLGSQAVELAVNRLPDLIILDVLLPAGNGFQIAQTIKDDERTAHIPILCVTALAVTDTQEKMKHIGCYACLTKPFSLDVLLKAVDQGMGFTPEKKSA